jgi:pimeloyl-ACP methyl ester carboxylesterase
MYFKLHCIIAVFFILVSCSTPVAMNNYTVQYLSWKENTIEFASGGEGIPMLVSHAGGGGYDQGLFIAETLLKDYRFICPSRFGYLGSTLPENADIKMQCDAYAALLDSLNIERTYVLALSAGGPSALHFAMYYPERVAGLIMLSAISLTDSVFDTRANFFTSLYKSDLRLKIVSSLFKRELLKKYGLNKSTLSGLSEDQRKTANRYLKNMLPAKPRYEGVVYDSRQGVSPNQWEIENITIPTLIIHAKDDQLIPYMHAQHTHDSIANSSILEFNSGGHGIFLLEKEKIARAMKKFVNENK